MLLGALLLFFVPACATRRLDYKLTCEYSVSDPQFERTMGTLLGPPILPGNSVGTFLNGSEIFPAMLDAIHRARETITFETFIFWSGRVGKDFTDALAERAAAGVRVHVLIDALGGLKIDRTWVATMRSAGAEVSFYHGIKWP